MNHATLRQTFYRSLSSHYLQGELQALYHWCVYEIEGWNRVQAYARNDDEVGKAQMQRWKEVIDRLAKKEPVQYIFGNAHFMDMELIVNGNVLIPRPETEELVEWVGSQLDSKGLRVLDIGTGSGCIALALKKIHPHWTVYGVDIDHAALDVAKKNAIRLGCEVSFVHADITKGLDLLSSMDVIVSNPPYIPEEDKEKMDSNVLDFEPDIALFAPNGDAFYFYRRIVELAQASRVKHVFFETHHQGGEALVDVLKPLWKGKIRAKKDLSGNHRLLHLYKEDDSSE